MVGFDNCLQMIQNIKMGQPVAKMRVLDSVLTFCLVKSLPKKIGTSTKFGFCKWTSSLKRGLFVTL